MRRFYVGRTIWCISGFRCNNCVTIYLELLPVYNLRLFFRNCYGLCWGFFQIFKHIYIVEDVLGCPRFDLLIIWPVLIDCCDGSFKIIYMCLTGRMEVHLLWRVRWWLVVTLHHQGHVWFESLVLLICTRGAFSFRFPLNSWFVMLKSVVVILPPLMPVMLANTTRLFFCKTRAAKLHKCSCLPK